MPSGDRALADLPERWNKQMGELGEEAFGAKFQPTNRGALMWGSGFSEKVV
jgi:hypothetical protein